MSKLDSRTQLMNYFGAKQKNVVWSWCAVNEEEKAVYFSIWTDLKNLYGAKDRPYYTIQEPHWGLDETSSSSNPARNDHDEKLHLVFNKGYKPYGYFIVAKNKNTLRRKIESTRTTFVMSLELEKLPTGEIIGYPVERINVK